MKRYNYGVALAVDGDFQTINTIAGPGIKDDYSRTRSEPFTFFVAPHNWIDEKLKISSLTGKVYDRHRHNQMLNCSKIKELILEYHGIAETKPSWSDEPDTDWHIKKAQ